MRNKYNTILQTIINQVEKNKLDRYGRIQQNYKTYKYSIFSLKDGVAKHIF